MDRRLTRAHCLGRRRFLQDSLALTGLGLVSGCGMMPSPSLPTKVRRVAFLADAQDDTQEAQLLEGLRQQGYVEGENLIFERRFARGNHDRFPTLIAELEGLGTECIVCGGIVACVWAKRSTTPIPLVSWQVINDVIDSGLVQSIARPEGNMTGTAGVSLLFQSKILEILAAAVPGVSRVGVLAHASAPALNIVLAGLEDAASRLNLQLNIETIASGGGVESLEPAFTALSAAGVHALLVAISLNFLTSEFRPRIAELARVHRLPSASPDSAFPKAGGLLAYSPNRPDVSHRVAWYVDKILKGAKPADLPMERPSKYDLVLNLKTAQALGLTIPPSVLAQATEVIT